MQQYVYQSQSPLALLHWLYKETLREQNYDSITVNPVLDSFVRNNAWGSFDYIYYTAKYLSLEDWSTVDFLLDYFPSNNILDDNYYQYFNWVYNYSNGNLSAINPVDVLALANRCPATNGDVVFAAQDLYNRLTNRINYFENTCGTMSARKLGLVKPIRNVDKLQVVNIFPNPATNRVSIIGKQIQQVRIIDALGNVLISKTLNNDSFVDIDIAALQGGLYIVQSVQKDGTILTNKLIKQ